MMKKKKASISYLHFYKMCQEDVIEYLISHGIDVEREFTCAILDNGGLIEYTQEENDDGC